MDPYLEGDLWISVHNELNIAMRRQLSKQLPVQYSILSERYLVLESLEGGLERYRPDVRIDYMDDAPSASLAVPATVPAPTDLLPVPAETELEIPFLKILSGTDNTLVTVIELLSPANKWGEGYEKYLQKRTSLRRQGVHFLEIDLIRRGKRTVRHPDFHPSDYLGALHRADGSATQVWKFSVKDRIPNLPVPLQSGDHDLVIDLQSALDEFYVESRCHYHIDYTANPPPPALSWRPNNS